MKMMNETKDEPEKLDLKSAGLVEDRRAQIARLFPEVRTEGGKLDFEQLKRALGETVDAGKERYGLVWPGKAECFKTIQAPSIATLRPATNESVNFDTTANLIIEGDNLEVLKLLQKSYLGKVKMIYIDPPYNTGNDFIYPDNYAERLQTYLEYTGQVDSEGRKFGTNTDADGRFHSKWLNMMYPRLYLARNLLQRDGLICISIDDREKSNLTRLCNEIFGEENYKGTIVRTTGQTTGQDSGGLGASFDYIVIYSMDADVELSGLPLDDDDLERYQEEDAKGKYALWQLRKTGSGDRREDRPTMFFAVKSPDNTDVWPIGPTGYESRWRYDPKGYKKLCDEDLIVWKKRPKNGAEDWWPYVKTYLEGRTKRPSPLWDDLDGSKKASRDLRALMDGNVFDHPKPVGLVRRLMQIAPPGESRPLFLDFFAGSGTLAQAVLESNRDGGDARFILVQLPEPTKVANGDGTYTETGASKAGYATIADVMKERVRRVIKKLQESEGGKLNLTVNKDQDRGFRVFKLAESNFKIWDAEPAKNADAVERQLALHIDHLRDDRTTYDFLYEILLKSGFPLAARAETLELAGKSVFSAVDGALFICLERELTLDLIRAMADRKPERAVCLDEGFAGNDQLKTNAVQTFKSKGVVFRTV
ncbi:MAG: site-specific DNA-methyltransferase [Steroidobacteraceae bacterium]